MSAMAAVDNSREQTHRERSPHELLSSPELRELVERLVRRKVPQGEVDDLVQTVLCDALEAATPPVEEEQLRRWLVGITRHKIADFHRSAGRGRQVELPEQLAADEPPIEAREWADWAYQQTQHSPEEQRTLDWMAREGGGEKLAHIAEDEELPAAQVRQRVSRLRRVMRRRWMAELAAVAAVGALVLVAYFMFREPDAPVAQPDAPAPAPTGPAIEPDVERAQQLRAEADGYCEAGKWRSCQERLDRAKELHPAGERDSTVLRLREKVTEIRVAEEGVEQTLEPVPSVAPSALPPPTPSMDPKSTKPAPPIPRYPAPTAELEPQQNSVPPVRPKSKQRLKK